MSLRVSSIQRFTMHDGPGVRTTFFLSGCPLRCAWCHNPEAQEQDPVLVFDRQQCIGCRLCECCPQGVHHFSEKHEIYRAACTRCGNCVERCPAQALTFSSFDLPDTDFFEEVEKNERVAGGLGGITFSGGEPLLQGEKILQLLEKVSVHAAMETCGFAGSDLFERVIGQMDYIMFDIKLADPDAHLRYTGVDNALIFQNLEILRRSGRPYLLRTPLIPGITDTQENLARIREIAGNDPWETLPYNPMTGAKYERIGRSFHL